MFHVIRNFSGSAKRHSAVIKGTNSDSNSTLAIFYLLFCVVEVNYFKRTQFPKPYCSIASSSDCSSLLVHPPSASGPQRENRPPSTCWYPCHLRWLPISAPAEKHSGHSSISGQSVQRSRRFVTSARQFTQYFFPRSAMLPGFCFLLLEADLRACALPPSPRDLLTSCFDIND